MLAIASAQSKYITRIEMLVMGSMIIYLTVISVWSQMEFILNFYIYQKVSPKDQF